jgi:uncharacterized protein YbjT (DUF2867 family)
MILIIGGTGNVGRHVVAALVGRGEPARVLTRDPGRARKLLGTGAEIVAGDLTDPSSLGPALRDVEKAYLATNGGDQVRMESNAIEAAQRAGVGQIVKLSGFLAAHPTVNVYGQAHAGIEERLAASAIPATILRPNWFMENFLGAAETIAGDGAIYGAAADGKAAFVDARDIAAVAVTALTENGHTGRTYAITGPEALTFAEAAAEIGAGIDREVRYVDLPDTDFRGALAGAGLPGDLVELFAQSYRAARLGLYDGVSGVVEELTGARARTLEAFARDYAGAFAGA